MRIVVSDTGHGMPPEVAERAFQLFFAARNELRPYADVQPALVLQDLHATPADGGVTELMLDRGANVRARWAASGAGGLVDAATLLAATARVANIPVAAANHAGHAH